jgi:hypothetical protein
MMFGGLIFTVAGEHGPAVAAAVIAAGDRRQPGEPDDPARGAGAPDLKVHWNPIPNRSRCCAWRASNWRCATRSWA